MPKSQSLVGVRARVGVSLSCLLCGVSLLATSVWSAPRDYYRVTVVDEQTGRGVPLVELSTTSNLRFYTDSNGVVAINDPDLLGQNVYFSVKSHGYEVPKDMFGYRGTALQVKAGEAGTIKIKRLNVAERLYRITGAGIYADSTLLGLPVPLQQPLLNGMVTGQDTVMATPYKGKIFWLWGDTNRPSYPLGNFATSCATSLLPGKGGLDPSVGVNLTYWVNNEGFSKGMMPMGSSMPVWLSSLFTVKDDKGVEQLFAKYAQVKSDSQVNEQGLARFNDEKAVFEKVFVAGPSVFPDGHPFAATVNGQPYIYFEATGSSEAFPTVRVRADLQHVQDQTQYEGYTPLVAGTRYDGDNTRLDRRPDGTLIYGWKANTPPLSFDQREKLVNVTMEVNNGKITRGGGSPFQLRDLETNKPIKSHGGSVYWNSYRKRWVMISGQAGGSPSYLGELWFAEADTPVGPWVYARKILTHDKYTFYNPTQHDFFDQDGGRQIYFEGTYTSTYSGTEEKTPRYDYNQIMYRLTLDDPRLTLPVPVYRVKNGPFMLRPQLVAAHQEGNVEPSIFMAMPPEGKHEGLVPIYQVNKGTIANPHYQIQTEVPAGAKPIFYALPANAEKVPTGVYPYRNAEDGAAVCQVWNNPCNITPSASEFTTQAR